MSVSIPRPRSCFLYSYLVMIVRRDRKYLSGILGSIYYGYRPDQSRRRHPGSLKHQPVFFLLFRLDDRAIGGCMGGPGRVVVVCYIGVLRRRLRSTQSPANLLFLILLCLEGEKNIACKGGVVSRWSALSSKGEKPVHSEGRVE